jgi:citrate lyase subunit beta / citryl-CoA lyase
MSWAANTSARTAGTWLFAPGNRPQRFVKAWSSGADLVVLDLEDAVPATEKDQARDEVSSVDPGAARLIVRVNAVGTPWHDDDLAALAGRDVVVMLPKAEATADVAATMNRLGPRAAVIPLVETARGVQRSWQLAEAPGVVRLALGHLDLATQLGIDPSDRTALLFARSTLVAASAGVGLAGPVDGVTTALRDDAVLKADVTHARSLGFEGKLLIHPAQIAASAAALRPPPDDVAWARTVLASTDTDGVRQLDGAMVDAPVVARAQRILARASE